MAVIPVEKIHIIAHKSIKGEFLHNLQKEGVVHITELKESAPQASEMLTRIHDALGQLSAYKKRGMLETFIKIKKPIDFDTFEKSAHSYDYVKTVEELETVKKEREQNQARLHSLEEDIELLSPWIRLKCDISHLKSLKQTDAIPCMIPSKEIWQRLKEKISDIPYSLEVVDDIGILYYIFFVKKEQSHDFRSILIENECDIIDFKNLTGVPDELIISLNKQMKETKDHINRLQQKEIKISKQISKLELTSDLIANEHKKEEVALCLPETTRTINIIGWVKKRELKRLDALIKESELAAYEKIDPDPGEKPPVALTNMKWTRPYEELVKLYSMPHPKEYDPTPFLAFFFPVFFALCITDAVYGIFLILFSMYLLKKVAGNKNLIWIILVGGILTIFTGAMVGGWVGDLFNYIGFAPLIKLRESLMLFDPLENPMIFIGIALGLGFVHMMLGIGIEVFDCIKNSDYGQAIFANLTWFLFLPSILLYFTVFKSSIPAKMVLEIVMWSSIVGIIVASHPEGKVKLLDHIVWAVIIFLLWYFVTKLILGGLFKIYYQIRVPKEALYLMIPLLFYEFMRFKKIKKILVKIAWGFYNFYGISSYLGIVLSYIRLMALGMATGVIAIAINKIAWMITGIPVIGIILVVIILIPSHLFNIVINALGGFIHTMRLQYIEFFGRFYSGGSKPFKPFGFETKYVEIE
jgi:V/A-type H+-transporting ATPase subunit I